MRYPEYHRPVLDRLVTVRNVADEPLIERDDYGQPVLDSLGRGRLLETDEQGVPLVTPMGPDGRPIWGVQLRANRRDKAPYTSYEEGAVVYVRETVWTIRERPGIAANFQVVEYATGKVYEAIGPPVDRGGPNGGRTARYLELRTRLRTT